MSTIKDMMESMYSRLDRFLKTETVIGEPKTVGSVQLIPIVTASFGLGGGFSDGAGSKDSDNGAGGGLGCRISPNAILVIQGDDVKLVSLESRRSLDKLFEQVPDILKMVKEMTEKGVSQEEEEGKESKTEE